MLVAIFQVHLPNGMYGEGGYQWALLLTACSLMLLVDGTGRASFDRFLSR